MAATIEEDGNLGWVTTLRNDLPYAEVAAQNERVDALRAEVATRRMDSWTPAVVRPRLWYSLDPDTNSVLIFKDLGVYTFTGSICENY